jgi:hypothetical protein
MDVSISDFSGVFLFLKGQVFQQRRGLRFPAEMGSTIGFAG